MLSILCVQSLRPAELTEQIDVTRTTVQRILSGFRDRNWVHKRDGTYRTTVTGQRVLRAYEALEEEVERAEACGPLAVHADQLSRRFEPELFTETDLTVATSHQPLAPIERYFSQITQEISRIYSVASMFTEASTGAIETFIEMDVTGELIYDEAMLEEVSESSLQTISRWDERDNCAVFTTSLPTDFGMTIADETVFVGGFTDGNLVILAEGSHPTLVASAKEFVEEIKADATPLSANLVE